LNWKQARVSKRSNAKQIKGYIWLLYFDSWFNYKNDFRLFWISAFCKFFIGHSPIINGNLCRINWWNGCIEFKTGIHLNWRLVRHQAMSSTAAGVLHKALVTGTTRCGYKISARVTRNNPPLSTLRYSGRDFIPTPCGPRDKCFVKDTCCSRGHCLVPHKTPIQMNPCLEFNAPVPPVDPAKVAVDNWRMAYENLQNAEIQNRRKSFL